MSVSERGYIPPDGGYGWIVLIACVVINSCLMPLTQCFGIIYEEYFTKMNISAAEISFLLHLNSSIMCSLGLFSGPLLKKFNYRQMALFGSSLVCTGIFLTAFVESYTAWILTVSVLIGTGQGILMPATYLAVNTYFKERLTLAVSLQVTGVGITPLVMPHICVFLLKNFGTKGTTLMLAALSLHALPAALLLRPIRSKPKCRKTSSIINDNVEPETENSLLDHPNQNGNIYKPTTIKKENGIFENICKIFNFRLLLDKGFILILIGMSISFASELNIVVMMPFVLLELAQFKIEDVAMAMSIQNGADILGRLMIPILNQKNKNFAKIGYCLALMGSSIGRTILASFSTHKYLVFLAAVFLGVSKGGKAVFQSLIIPKYVPYENLAAATGLSMVSNGISSLIIGPIIGLTHDVSNSYILTLHTATSLSMLCVGLWAVDHYFVRHKRNEDEEAKD